MKAIDLNGIPPDVLADLEDAIRGVLQGPPTPEVMQKAGDEQDRLREELRQRVGELSVAVDFVREARDSE
jgi:hypothetical protein